MQDSTVDTARPEDKVEKVDNGHTEVATDETPLALRRPRRKIKKPSNRFDSAECVNKYYGEDWRCEDDFKEDQYSIEAPISISDGVTASL